MQVKLWPADSSRDGLLSFKKALCHLSLLGVLILSGCASVKSPDTGALKSPESVQSATAASTTIVTPGPGIVEPIAPPPPLKELPEALRM